MSEGASFAELSIERIATRAGLSRTAFYFYFRDKRELLTRLTDEVADLLYAEADRWWSSEGGGREELRAALARVIALYHEHAVLLRAVVETAAYDEPMAQAWRSIVGRFVQATRRRIEAEQAAGAAPASLPAEETAFALSWMTERACYQSLVQGRDDELPEALTEIWLRAIYGGAG
jgi:TetR/AcrR family transcriptional regulator, ethionamide resistance regulator